MDQHIPEVDGIGCDVLVVYAHHQDARYDYGNQLSSAQRDFRNMVLDFHIVSVDLHRIFVQAWKAG